MPKHFLPLLSLSLTTVFGCAFASETIVIDAGSSGSRLHVYNVINGMVKELASYKVKPGISMAADPAASIKGLIQQAENAYPQTHGANFYLMATAGMRLLPQSKQQGIYQSISNMIRNSYADLQVKYIGTITGQWEGIYDWIAANMQENGDISQNSSITKGVLDLGGASTEIAYAVDQADKGNTVSIKLANNTYHIKSFSYLGLGEDQAIAQYLNDADCFRLNYTTPSKKPGTGNIEACENHIIPLLNIHDIKKDTADAKSKDFVVVSGFSYLAEALNKTDHIQVQDYDSDFAKQKFCIQPDTVTDPAFAYKYCFSAAYIKDLLTKGYMFAADKQLAVGTNVDWPQGVALYFAANAGHS